MNYPVWLKGYLAQSEVKKLEDTVAEVETQTCGEIVPMIVRSSSTVGHVPVVLFLFALASLLMIDVEGWTGLLAGDSYRAAWLWPVVIILFMAIGARIGLVRRCLIPLEDQLEQVQRRAEVEFFEAGLHKTDGSTGILIFLSLFERQAVVLADETIAERLPASTWNDVVELVISGAKKKNLSEGLIAALKKCGDILSPHFPAAKNDRNELSNKIVVKE